MVTHPPDCAVRVLLCSFVLLPLWTAAADCFPVLRARVEQLHSNMGQYSAVLAAADEPDHGSGSSSGTAATDPSPSDATPSS